MSGKTRSVRRRVHRAIFLSASNSAMRQMTKTSEKSEKTLDEISSNAIILAVWVVLAPSGEMFRPWADARSGGTPAALLGQSEIHGKEVIDKDGQKSEKGR